MSDVHPNTRYRTVGYAIANTSKVAALTCGAGSYIDLTGASICASAGSGRALSLYYYSAVQAAEFTISYEVTVPNVGHLHVVFDPLHLNPGDEFRVEGEADMDVVMSLIEGGRNVGIG